MAFRKILRYSLIASNKQVLFGTSQILNTVLAMKVHVHEQYKYIFYK